MDLFSLPHSTIINIQIALADENEKRFIRRALLPLDYQNHSLFPSSHSTFSSIKPAYEQCPIYKNGDDISGIVKIFLNSDGNILPSLRHNGIILEFRGTISMPFGKDGKGSLKIMDFLFHKLMLEGEGESFNDLIIPFSFGPMRLPFDSYDGKSVSVHYYLKITIIKKMSFNDIFMERFIWVYNERNGENELSLSNPLNSFNIPSNSPLPSPLPSSHPLSRHSECKSINIHVGIEEKLHVQIFLENMIIASFEDWIRGKISFNLVLSKIIAAELCLYKAEVLKGEEININENSINNGNNHNSNNSNNQNDDADFYCNNDLVGRIQILDGTALLGDEIHFAMPLYPYRYKLTPSYHRVNNQFSITYFICFMLIDEVGRKFYKKQEIILSHNYNNLIYRESLI